MDHKLLRKSIPSTGFAIALSLIGLLLCANHVYAYPRDYNGYGQPVDKAGLFMLNVRGGPVVGLLNADTPINLLGSVGMDIGFAVSRDYNAYIILTPNLQAGSNFFHVSVPIGFQYDIRLARGLYIYPRVSLGFSSMIFTSAADYGPLHYYSSDIIHGGTFIPEFGIKYVVNGRLNLGLEPISTPIFFNQNGYSLWYRFMFFIGFNA